ncbi:MAG TPA: hypothetical protein VHU87_06265 [Rhizomicrobium sp.]|jgi:antitoxin VapB|nr:hypothetical protein [Rhizomicrobium sp.]
MGVERPVKLYRDGTAQAVQIPREFELPGEDAVMRKEGDKIVITPGKSEQKKSVAELLASWEPLDDEFPQISDLPPDPVDRF